MTRRKVIWHIGPADPGTAFLADALQGRSLELAERGVSVPTGAWHEIEDQIWKHKGVSLVSTPDISRADADKIALHLTGLRDLEVHLVLLVRDLPTQVYAAWQAGLAHGSTTPLKKYTARLTDPSREHWQAEEFWAGHDLGRILQGWTRAIHAERVHVISVDQDPDASWTALLGAAGVTDLPRPEAFTAPALRAELDPEWVLDVTTAWAKLIADRGFDLQGSVINASAASAGVGAGRSDQLEAVAELLTRATAEVERLTAEVVELRAANERLDAKRLKHKRRVERLRADLSSPS
ncbi:hypothetical protein ABIE44_002100 [Marmoricola sp. OAE513]|uniref:hypothetical protein n=1 Tax=Marmoricola sp. OAE513 TaxID=2817894 RepID=UPI001AE2E0A3